MSSSKCSPEDLSEWQEIVARYYPDWHTKTYAVPSLHFNRVPYTTIKVPGSNVKALLLLTSQYQTSDQESSELCESCAQTSTQTPDGGEFSSSETSSACPTTVPSTTTTTVPDMPDTADLPDAAACLERDAVAKESRIRSVKSVVNTKTVTGFESHKGRSKEGIRCGTFRRDYFVDLSFCAPERQRPRTKLAKSGSFSEFISERCDKEFTAGASLPADGPVLPQQSGSCQRKRHKKKKKKKRSRSDPSPPAVLFQRETGMKTSLYFESDFYDDLAQDFVVKRLQELGDFLRQPMFILSQFKYEIQHPKTKAPTADPQKPSPTRNAQSSPVLDSPLSTEAPMGEARLSTLSSAHAAHCTTSDICTHAVHPFTPEVVSSLSVSKQMSTKKTEYNPSTPGVGTHSIPSVQDSQLATSASDSPLITPAEEVHPLTPEAVAPFPTDEKAAHLTPPAEDAQPLTRELAAASHLPRLAASAAADSHLPRPAPEKPAAGETCPRRACRGEVDFLVIHRVYGVLLGELKTVGRYRGQGADPAEVDRDVARRLKKAAEQLAKSEGVVRGMLHGVMPNLRMCKALFLPYVRRCELRRVLCDDPQIGECVQRCLEAGTVEQAVERCVCADELCDPWDPHSCGRADLGALWGLVRWWQKGMGRCPDPRLADEEGQDLYLKILASFIGPASSQTLCGIVRPALDVQTHARRVRELGRRMTRLVLTPKQLSLLHDNGRLVCLTGPPGTGKTVVLVLQGLRWLREGRHVHVVSTRLASHTVSKLIEHQLKETAKVILTPAASDRVHAHDYDFYYRPGDLERACAELTAFAENGALYVIMDEIACINRYEVTPKIARLVVTLVNSAPDLHLWGACVSHGEGCVPLPLVEATLGTPLRCAPVVLREVVQGMERCEIRPYTQSVVPAPGQGPDVIHLHHQGDLHPCPWPVQCDECGRNVVRVLRRLDVGRTGDGLRWRDVLIATRSIELQDDVSDGSGRVTSPACGFVRALRAEGVPVVVLGMEEAKRERASWTPRSREVATASREEVTVADFGCVLGLERCVVVWLQGRVGGGRDEGVGDEKLEAQDRVYLASRCTTQLVIVHRNP